MSLPFPVGYRQRRVRRMQARQIASKEQEKHRQVLRAPSHRRHVRTHLGHRYLHVRLENRHGCCTRGSPAGRTNWLRACPAAGGSQLVQRKHATRRPNKEIWPLETQLQICWSLWKL
uniref:Uncharacterized protein n=1 Tax=Macrostomum lignano TaxID=282301 RepID=A0A1I8I1H6_9PLAT